MQRWLAYLLYGRTVTSMEVPDATASGPTRAARLLLASLAETIRRLLGLAQELTLEVPSLQPTAFRQELERICHVYRRPLSAADDLGLRKQALRAVAGQRQRELEFVRGREIELREIIGLVTGELQGLDQDGREFAAGIAPALADLGRAVEIEELRQVRGRLQEQVTRIRQQVELKEQRDQERLRSLTEQLEALGAKAELVPDPAQTDPLTRLYTRTAFDKQVRTEVSLARRLCRPLSLVMIDVDRFQMANDTYGREACDDLLVQITGRIVREFFRTTDFIARYDGEEFAVLLTQQKLDVAGRAAEGLCAGLAQRPLAVPTGEATLTISAGVVQHVPGEIWEAFVGRAADALGRAKAAGCNRVCKAEDPQGRAVA